MHNSVLGIYFSVVYYIKGPTVTNMLVFFFLCKLTNKNTCVSGKFPVVDVIKPPMFQQLKCHYQGVRTVTDICTCRHTCNTSVHILFQFMYDNTGVRKVNFVLSKVQMSRCVQIHILWLEV